MRGEFVLLANARFLSLLYSMIDSGRNAPTIITNDLRNIYIFIIRTTCTSKLHPFSFVFSPSPFLKLVSLEQGPGYSEPTFVNGFSFSFIHHGE